MFSVSPKGGRGRSTHLFTVFTQHRIASNACAKANPPLLFNPGENTDATFPCHAMAISIFKARCNRAMWHNYYPSMSLGTK